MSYGERAELLDVQYQEVTKQADVLTKAAIALITQNPWAAFGLNTAADGIISGEINLKNVVKDAAFTYFSGGIQGSSAKFGSQKWLTDTAVRSVKEGGIRTAVYGGSLKDNIAGAATTLAINDATAFAHGKIGDVKEIGNWGEGSFPGAVQKGAAGCISSDLNGGNCGRGAVLAAGAEFATGLLHYQSGGNTDATAEAMLRYGNPILAALASGGDVGQFSINQGIADSQLKNNYLFHAEAERKSALLEREEALGCAPSSANTECRAIRNEIAQLEILDRERDAALENACRQGGYSPGCINERRKAKLALNSYIEAGYNPTTGEYDPVLGTEYIDVAAQYGFTNSEAMSEAARAALLQIPVDTTTGLLVLADISKDALAGDPEARAQLWAAAAATKQLVLHPVDTISAGVKRDLELADQLEAEGKYFEADTLRSKTILNLQLSVTGAGGAATGLVKGVL